MDGEEEQLFGSGKVTKHLFGVKDRESFAAFVRTLIEEREEAEELERENPERYKYLGGALGWQQRAISSYLNAALACVEDSESFKEPSWRAFAEFLHGGKIYE